MLAQRLEPSAHVAGILLAKRPGEDVGQGKQRLFGGPSVEGDYVATNALGSPKISDRSSVSLVLVVEPTGVNDERTGLERIV